MTYLRGVGTPSRTSCNSYLEESTSVIFSLNVFCCRPFRVRFKSDLLSLDFKRAVSVLLSEERVILVASRV